MNYFEQGKIVARLVNQGDDAGAQNILTATMDAARVDGFDYEDAYRDYLRGYHSELHKSRLAVAFRNSMRAALTGDDLASIDAANEKDTTKVNPLTGFEYGTCASHDLTDPNQHMIDALESIGLELNLESSKQIALINDVWETVRHSGFSFRVLFESINDDGEKDVPVLTFLTTGGDFIYMPATSECGRFPVDPIAYYGLTPEQVEQMRAFNGAISID